MIKSNFREWTLTKVTRAFGIKQSFKNDLLNDWMACAYEINDFERQYLLQLQETLAFGGDDWNETELENKFISPLIVFARFDNVRYAYFLERDLALTIGDYELSGRVDGMIASGYREPEKPYFCMSEYKRESDPTGDPKGQALITMLVARELNDNNHEKPIYGLYIVGRQWRFMVLDKNEYVISKGFLADDKGIFDIYRILKGLRHLIDKLIDG